jgi:hypothetical protein
MSLSHVVGVVGVMACGEVVESFRFGRRLTSTRFDHLKHFLGGSSTPQPLPFIPTFHSLKVTITSSILFTIDQPFSGCCFLCD